MHGASLTLQCPTAPYQAPRVRPEDVVALPRRLRQVDDDLLNMMQLALDCDPGTRPSCDELLQHTFFHGFASQCAPRRRATDLVHHSHLARSHQVRAHAA